MKDQTFPQSQLEEFSAGVIVYREQGPQRVYLLLHYPSGHWDFPKGHLENEETERQAAVRELAEETGITDSQIHPDFQDSMIYFFKRQGGLVKKTVTFFLGQTSNPTVKISHEHKGYLWLDYQSCLHKITFENSRAMLRRAEECLQK